MIPQIIRRMSSQYHIWLARLTQEVALRFIGVQAACVQSTRCNNVGRMYGVSLVYKQPVPKAKILQVVVHNLRIAEAQNVTLDIRDRTDISVAHVRKAHINRHQGRGRAPIVGMNQTHQREAFPKTPVHVTRDIRDQTVLDVKHVRLVHINQQQDLSLQYEAVLPCTGPVSKRCGS
jgi:hypothetical protein